MNRIHFIYPFFLLLPECTFCRVNTTFERIFAGSFRVEQTPSQVLEKNFDIAVTRLEWFVKDSSTIAGLRFTFDSGESTYFAPDGGVAPQGTPDGTFQMPAKEWFVKGTFSYSSTGQWQSFQLVTNTMKAAQKGNTSGTEFSRIAAPCRQIVGVSFIEGQPSGVLEKMRPFYLKDLASVAESKPVVASSGPRQGSSFGCNNLLKTQAVGSTRMYCKGYLDPHYNPQFNGGWSAKIGNGVYWSGRNKDPKKFAMQEYDCAPGSSFPNILSLKIRSGPNLIWVYRQTAGGYKVNINGEATTVVDAAKGLYAGNCVNDLDGDASVDWADMGSRLNYNFYFDPASLDQTFGRCNTVTENQEVKSNEELLFTTQELTLLRSLCPSNQSSLSGSPKPEEVCAKTGVLFTSATKACGELPEPNWRKDCQIEFCGNIENREVVGYIAGERDSAICMGSKLTMELCIALDHTRLPATSVVEMQSSSQIETADWFMCEEACAATPLCQQVVFEMSSKTCTGYSSVVASRPKEVSVGVVSSLCRSARYQWARSAAPLRRQVIDILLCAFGIILCMSRVRKI